MYLPWKEMSASQQAEALSITDAIHAELLPLVIGKTLPPWSCCCGALSHAEATATEICAPGRGGGQYPDQNAGALTYRVTMREPDGRNYSCGMSEFVPDADVYAIFERHWRPFFVTHFPKDLATREARNAPGGDLAWRPINIWF